MRRDLAICGALLLIGTAIPAATAHWGESGANGQPTAETSNVAGTVTGYAGPAVIDTAGDDVAARDTAVAAEIGCDREVVFGDRWTPYDEAEVDENANPFPVSTPDNVYNDGGTGGACHSNGYVLDAFNTAGCSGEARASIDGLGQPGTGAYVSASCDAGTISEGTNPGPSDVLSAAVCSANEVLSGSLAFVSCLDPVTSGGTGYVNCDNDGSTDASNTGYATPATGPAVPSVTCDVETDADSNAAAVFWYFPVVDLRGSVGTPPTHVWTT